MPRVRSKSSGRKTKVSKRKSPVRKTKVSKRKSPVRKTKVSKSKHEYVIFTPMLYNTTNNELIQAPISIALPWYKKQMTIINKAGLQEKVLSVEKYSANQIKINLTHRRPENIGKLGAELMASTVSDPDDDGNHSVRYNGKSYLMVPRHVIVSSGVVNY